MTTDVVATAPHAARTLSMDWHDCHVVVMGLGSFGGTLGAIRWLVGQGARVLVTDQASSDMLADSVSIVSDLDIELRLGGHSESDLNGANLLVVSPAVNKTKSGFFQAAVEKGIPWTSEMNLFLERCPCPIVGVT